MKPTLALLLVPLLASAAEPVFSGAQGHGIQTPAGRGGRIIRVTNLNAEGPGSFVEALATKGRRLIVFEVGGVIDLGAKRIEIAEPFLSVEGQTAPSPGITLIRGGLTVSTNDVLIRHIRVRPGDCGKPKRSGWDPDGLTTYRAARVVIDHCSFTWAVDENLSVSGLNPSSGDVTFSHCLIAEGLRNATHGKGAHSMGTLVFGNNQRIAILFNLYACNDVRNPRFNGGCAATVANNFIYNPGGQVIHLNNSNPAVTIAGNVLRHGPSTKPGVTMISGGSSASTTNNLAFDREGKPAPVAGKGIVPLPARKDWPPGFVALPAEKVEEYVLAHAGARPRDRDEVDRRIIGLVKERKGAVIDSQEEVGGYPKAAPTKRTLDIPATNVQKWLDELARAVE